MLNLNDVRFFVKVVECNGFAPAARALRLPKSTLSKRVAELERTLDVSLIRRTTRRFVVTPLGREFHRQATAMIELAEAAEQVVRGRLAEPTGPVSVTCSVPTAQGWLAALLPKIARRFPKLRIALHATDRFVDIIRDGFDIAVRDHFHPLADSTLVQRRIAVDPMVLVASPRYLSRRTAPQQPGDLASHDALLTRNAPSTWTLTRGEQESVEVTVSPRFAADETTVLLAAAKGGLGIAALPRRSCREDIAAGALRRVLPGWTAGKVTTTLLLADRRAQLPSVRAVADAIAAALGAAERE